VGAQLRLGSEGRKRERKGGEGGKVRRKFAKISRDTESVGRMFRFPKKGPAAKRMLQSREGVFKSGGRRKHDCVAGPGRCDLDAEKYLKLTEKTAEKKASALAIARGSL